MLLKADKNKARQKRHLRVRNHIAGTTARPRLNVYRSLANIYAQVIDDEKGVTEIDVKGKEFDADLCEAVAKFAAGEEMQGKVVDIVQTGYMLGDKVLRFAKVVVGE